MFYLICKTLVLPPGLQLAGGIAGLLCLGRWRRLGLLLLALSLGSLWLLATPWAAGELARLLEGRYRPVDLERLEAMQPAAILILGGGSYRAAPEYAGFDEVSRITLERLRYGARLHRQTGLDIAVTGGLGPDMSTPEGVQMATVLEADFGVPVRWHERASRNTAENAAFSARRFAFRNIVLVTHAVHMPRAVRAFGDAGFEVIAAPMGFISRGRGGFTPRDLLPDMKSLGQSHYVLYEAIGALWYRLRYA